MATGTVASVNELTKNKTTILNIDATSYTFTTQAAWEYVFSVIPGGFYGNLLVEFSGGNKCFVMAAKGSATYGNMIGIVGSSYNPYFFGRSGNTIVFKQLALIT